MGKPTSFWKIFFLVFLFFGRLVFAADSYLQGETVVANYSAAQLLQGFRLAFSDVLEKITKDHDLAFNLSQKPKDWQLKRAVVSYQYSLDDNQQIILLVKFNKNFIDRSIPDQFRQLKKQVLLVFVGMENPDGSYSVLNKDVDERYHNTFQKLIDYAHSLNISPIFPSSQNKQLSAIFQQNDFSILQNSIGVSDINSVLIGKISLSGTANFYQIDENKNLSPFPDNFSNDGNDLNLLLKNAVNFVASNFTHRQENLEKNNLKTKFSFLVKIDNVDDLSAIITLQNFFQGLEAVKKAQLLMLDKKVASFSLTSSLDQEALSDYLQKNLTYFDQSQNQQFTFIEAHETVEE